MTNSPAKPVITIEAIKKELRKAKEQELRTRYDNNVIVGYTNVGRVRALRDLLAAHNH